MSVTLTLTESNFQPGHLRLNDTTLSDGEMKRQIKETRDAELVVFDNTTQGLGLKICGGCSIDGKEEHGIFVKRVLPGGLAETSDCVQNGDLILEVNKQTMEGITYDRAVSMLRQASASNHVEMVVTRDEEARIHYAHFVSLNETAHSPRSATETAHSPMRANDTSHNSDPTADGDIDFQRKMNAFLKDTSLELNSSGEQNYSNTSARAGEINGHVSPTSSTASELANHLGDVSFSPRGHTPNIKSHQTIPKQGVNVDGLDSLLSKKLSQDPGLRLHIDQLESAMIKLGFDLPPATQQVVRDRVSVDSDGMVKFDEFVQVAKSLFHKDLGALKGRITPLNNTDLQGAGTQASSQSAVVKERDSLLAEVAALKQDLLNQRQACHCKEEQLLFIGKQMQVVTEDRRSLKSKLHLAEQAQARAQQTEHDYEEVVAMLENEVSQLRLQSTKSDNTNMKKRLAVLVCQLKKTESGKKTYEVATEKLMRCIEHSVDVLSSVENSPRVPEGAKAKNARKKTLSSLAAEGRDTIKTVISLMESVPLPFGWEEAYTSDGVRYFINHMNQTTSWTHPVSGMEHQTETKALPNQNDKNQSALSPIRLPPPPPPHSSQQFPAIAGSGEHIPSPRSEDSKSQTSPRDQHPSMPLAPPRNNSKKKGNKNAIDKSLAAS